MKEIFVRIRLTFTPPGTAIRELWEGLNFFRSSRSTDYQSCEMLRLLDKRRKPNCFVTSCCFSIFPRTCGVWPIVFFYWRRRRRQSRSKSCSVDDTTFICHDRDDESSRGLVYIAGSNCARIIFKLNLYIVVTLMNGPPLPSWSISHTQLSRSRENWCS
jgi:hypothetical protein